MSFPRTSHFKSSLAVRKAGTTHIFTSLLVAGLLGVHLTLLTVGTFCASTATNPNPSHHEDHQSSTSILCIWACQVAKIAASATPTEHLTPLPLLILLVVVLPLTIPLMVPPFSFASPRGPPLR